MKKRAFEKLLREAIILEAEEQGAHMDASNEPIPEAAQARFDAALNGNRKEPKRMIADASSEQLQPVKRAHRWLAYGLTAVSAAVVILIVALLIGTGGLRGTKPQESEPLPYASATFADRNAASIAMKRFYEENRTLLMAVAEDMKAPEHGMIENGVVYPIKDNGFADRDHPYASMTDSIRAFLDLPDSGDYILSWDDESVFSVSLRWTNDSGYYSTKLVYAQDGQKIVTMMYEKDGSTLEPVYEDCGWGVYTSCWQKAPYYHDASYALGPEVGVWETDDVPFLYLELFDDGTTRILEMYGDTDIRAHYAWSMPSRNIVLLTFSDQTVVKTAELNTDTDAMSLTLADGSTVEAARAEDYRLIVNGKEVPVDSIFRESAKGEVHLMVPMSVKGTVLLTTADRQKRQENRPPDIENKTDNTETIAGFSVTKESDEEMTEYLKNRQWKELPEDNDKQGLLGQRGKKGVRIRT